MNRLFIFLFSCFLFSCAGCTQKAIVISKGGVDERGGIQGTAMLGSGRNSQLEHDFCNGDIERILARTSLDVLQQQEFREKFCGIHRSEEEIAEYFNSLPLKQRREFEKACERYGYHLNDYG